MQGLFDNFAVRLVVYVVVNIAVFTFVFFLLDSLLWHEQFEFDLIWNLIIPVIISVFEAINWRRRGRE